MARDTLQDDWLAFNPVSSHNDGLAISSVQTITVPSGANKWMVQALTQNVRFTLDGTAATTTCGFQLKAGDPPIIIPVGSRTTIKVIEESATADLQYQFGN